MPEEMGEASIPDLFGPREQSSPQHIKTLPEKCKSFLGFAPTSVNRGLHSNHDSPVFSDFVKGALTSTPAFPQSNWAARLGTAYRNSGHVWCS